MDLPAPFIERHHSHRGASTRAATDARPTVRLGAVQYLNTRPLVHGLGRGSTDRGNAAAPLNVVYDLPSRLADRLAGGQLDIGLIPIVELLRGGATLVSNACIACRGPVMSVKLFFRTRPEQVARLALDEGSRTSAALARILLAERYGVRPRFASLPIGASIGDTDADAVLLIGDRALEPVIGSFQLVWDLGDEWVRWTGLPFVFAAWAARPGVESTGIDLPQVAAELEAARDRGVSNLAAIAAVEAAGHGLTVPQCLSYLRDNLHYQVGDAETAAIRRFRDLAVAHGLLTGGTSPTPAPARRRGADAA